MDRSQQFFWFNHYSHATYLDHGEIMYVRSVSCPLSARWRHVAQWSSGRTLHFCQLRRDRLTETAMGRRSQEQLSDR